MPPALVFALQKICFRVKTLQERARHSKILSRFFRALYIIFVDMMLLHFFGRQRHGGQYCDIPHRHEQLDEYTCRALLGNFGARG